MDKRMQLIE